MPVHASNRAYRFGNQVVKSLGMVELALEKPNEIQRIPVLLDIVPLNVPALLSFIFLIDKTYYLAMLLIAYGIA